MIPYMSCPSVSPPNGGEPVSSSNMMTPSCQMSVRESTVFGVTNCSGDM